MPLAKVMGPALRLNLPPGKHLDLGQCLLERREYLSPDFQVEALTRQARNQSARRTGVIPSAGDTFPPSRFRPTRSQPEVRT